MSLLPMSLLMKLLKPDLNSSDRLLFFSIVAILMLGTLQVAYLTSFLNKITAVAFIEINENVDSATHLAMTMKSLDDLRLEMSNHHHLAPKEAIEFQTKLETIKAEINHWLSAYREILKVCESRGERETEILAFEKDLNKIYQMQNHFFDLTGHHKSAESVNYYLREIYPISVKASQRLSKMILDEQKHSIDERTQIGENQKASVRMIWYFLVGTLILSLAVIYFIFYRYFRMNRKVQISEKINENRLHVLAITAANIGHEIKNPLTVLSARVELSLRALKKVPIENDKIEKNLTQALSYVERISKIVDGLKALSHKDKDNDAPMETEDLNKIVNVTIDLSAQKLKYAGIELRTPQSIPQVTLCCHPVQISQVILNLINNACDAIATNSEKWIELSYMIRTEKSGNLVREELVIQITDSGKGITPETASKILQPFYTTKSRGKGTGIGLSVSQEIMKNHQGHLNIDTQYANTRFEIILPLTQKPSVDAAIKTSNGSSNNAA
jgi:signal transduction histidine kinase